MNNHEIPIGTTVRINPKDITWRDNGDLISREALKKSLNFVYDCDYIGSTSKEGIASDIIEKIDNAPTVEPIKQCKYCKHCGNEGYCSNCHSDHSLFEYYNRPTGEWIDDNEEDSYYANCSHCGYQIDTHYERGYLNYCPNCGADMRGGRE